MSTKLIAVDMSGTFLSDQKTYNRERLMVQYQRVKAQGTRFVVASGNRYYQLTSFFPEIASEIALVAENGGWIVNEGKDVFNGELSKDASAAIMEYLPMRPEVEIITCRKSSAYTPKKYDDAVKTVVEIYYHRLEYVDNFDNLEDIFFKFDLSLSGEPIPQVQEVLREAIDDIMVLAHTGNGNVDLIIPGVHKANGPRQLQKLWGIDDSEVVVFSDDGSDTGVLHQAGSSFAMENAGSVVVAVAKYRAGPSNCEGVLDVIDEVPKREAPFKQ